MLAQSTNAYSSYSAGKFALKKQMLFGHEPQGEIIRSKIHKISQDNSRQSKIRLSSTS